MPKRLPTYLFSLLLAAAFALGIASPASAVVPLHRDEVAAANGLVVLTAHHHHHHHKRPRHQHHH